MEPPKDYDGPSLSTNSSNVPPVDHEKHSKGFLSSLSSRIPGRSSESTTLRPYDESQDYLLGVRGCLVPMAFCWTFLQTFVPAAVKASANTTGETWELALRKSLSVLFWNDTLIYGSIVFLSARTICVPFLLDPTKATLAGSVFRRGFSLWLPVAATLIIVYGVFTHAMGGNQYLVDFAALTGNTSMITGLYIIPSSLANFNAIFMTFWITYGFQTQAGSWAFPTQMLWIISVVFQQSYTVFMSMTIIPYTRQRWRVYGAFAFIATAWWVYSWAWYSITGLLIADAVMNMGMRPGQSGTSFSMGKLRVPFWMVGVVFMAAGFAMQFVWVAVRPDLMNEELYYHTSIYLTGGIQYGIDVSTAQIRADCYLIITGFWLILETSSILQSIFRMKFLVVLGRRSLSYFLTQSIIIYTLGIKLATNTMAGDVSKLPRARGIAFVATLIVSIVAAEAMYWVVERPSRWLGRKAWDWIRE
nr:hypothetical protein B0A51_16988 [Rachicladosporium sp. CCFEE 5018]